MNDVKLVTVFSLVSGQIFNILSDEVKTLYNYQIVLKSLPQSSCKTCYGRGYAGKRVDGTLNICKCMVKHFSDRKEQEIMVYLPRMV